MPITLNAYIDFNGDGDFNDPNENITGYVQEWHFSRGIDDPMARVASVGICNITVDNRDRRFSPAYVGGPLYGYLKMGLKVQIVLQDGVQAFPVFTGYTRAFRPTSGQYAARNAVIECADLMQKMQDHALALPMQTNREMAYMLRLIMANTLRGDTSGAQITFTALPAVGDWFEVAGARLTFTDAVPAANQVRRVTTSVEDTIDRAVAAINGDIGSGPAYGTNTIRPESVVAQARQSYSRNVRADLPIRYYRLDETVGTTANDSGQNNAPGSTVNVTLGAAGLLVGDPNPAMAFNGTSSYIALPTLDFMNRSFTIEAWLYADASPTGSQVFFSAHSANVTQQSMVCRLNTNGQIWFDFTNNGTGSFAGAFPFAQPNHVVCSYDYATGMMSVYVNGVLQWQTTRGPFLGVDPILNIGRRAGFNSEYWRGRIDELAVYWHALPVERIVAHYAARDAGLGITVQANARGSWANGIALSKSSTAITLSSATLQGGTDGPAGSLNTEIGRATFDVAGDQWLSGETSALDAATEVIETERGLLWSDRLGVLQARNRDCEMAQANRPADLVLNSDPNEIEFMADDEGLFNRIVVGYTPRGELAPGLIAKSANVIAVPGLMGNDRWAPGADLDPKNYENPDGGLYVTTLPYTDPAGGGRFIGAKSITLPLRPGIDYTIYDDRDGQGFNYTHNGHVSISLAATASGIEVSLKNRALGTLYVRELMIYGVGIVAYDRQEAILEDSASMDAHGRRTWNIELPLTGDEAFAKALAAHLLQRHKMPATRVGRIIFNDIAAPVGTVRLYNLDAGAIVHLTDYQTGVTTHRYLLTGLEMNWQAGNQVIDGSFALRRLDDVQYLILDDATYGRPNGTYYLTL